MALGCPYYSYDIKRHNQFETQLLVFGYIRQCVNENGITAIVQLCQLFFEPLFLWHFSGDKLKEFKSKKHGEYFESALFHLHGQLKLRFKLYPDGKTEKQKGLVRFGFEIAECAQAMDNSALYIEFFCLETCTVYKRTGILKNGDTPGWHRYSLRSNEFANSENLTFGAYFNILWIQRKNRAKIFFRYPKVNVKMEKNWLITGELLKKFQTCDYGKRFYSENFGLDDNLCLMCYPNRRNLELELRLNTLPYNIEEMRVGFKLLVVYDGIHAKSLDTSGVHLFGYDKWSISCELIYGSDETTKLLTAEANICFKIEVTVLELLEAGSVRIEKEDWDEYVA